MEAILLLFAQLLMYGFTLGIGFWMSRKLTNLIDELLFSLNRKQLLSTLSIGA